MNYRDVDRAAVAGALKQAFRPPDDGQGRFDDLLARIAAQDGESELEAEEEEVAERRAC